jgi:hypothetical protein
MVQIENLQAHVRGAALHVVPHAGKPRVAVFDTLLNWSC